MISFIALYNENIWTTTIKLPYWLYYFDDTDQEHKDLIKGSSERWYSYVINLKLFKKENLIKTYEEYQNVLEKYSLNYEESNIKYYINLKYHDVNRSEKEYKWYIYREWMIEDRKKFFEEINLLQYSTSLIKNKETIQEILKYFNMPESWEVVWEFEIDGEEVYDWYGEYDTFETYSYHLYKYWFNESWNFFIKRSIIDVTQEEYDEFSKWYKHNDDETLFEYTEKRIAEHQWHLYNKKFVDYFIIVCISLFDNKNYELKDWVLEYHFDNIKNDKRPRFTSYNNFFKFEKNPNNYVFEYKDWKFLVTSKFDDKNLENCIEEINELWRNNDNCFSLRIIHEYDDFSINIFTKKFIYLNYDVSEIYKEINTILSKYDTNIQDMMKFFFQRSNSMMLSFKHVFENIEKYLIQMKDLSNRWTYHYKYWINLQNFWYKSWYETIYWLWQTANQERKEPFSVEELKRWSLDYNNWSYHIYPEYLWEIDKYNFIEYALHNKLYFYFENDFNLCALRLDLSWSQKEKILKAQKEIDIQSYLEAIRDKNENYWQFVSDIIRWSLTKISVEDFKTHFQWKLTNYELSELFKYTKDSELKDYVYTLIPQSYKDFKELHMFK